MMVSRPENQNITLFPTLGKVYVWKTPKETYNPECLVPTVKDGGGSVMVWAAILWYNILLARCLAVVIWVTIL
jgi:hypothetical protein